MAKNENSNNNLPTPEEMQENMKKLVQGILEKKWKKEKANTNKAKLKIVNEEIKILKEELKKSEEKLKNIKKEFKKFKKEILSKIKDKKLSKDLTEEMFESLMQSAIENIKVVMSIHEEIAQKLSSK